MDIRMETRVIVKRGALFLVGKILYSHEYRWSGSPYDAWNTRDLTIARCVAKKIGGTFICSIRLSGNYGR